MKKLFLLIGLVVFISTHAKAQSENIVENIDPIIILIMTSVFDIEKMPLFGGGVVEKDMIDNFKSQIDGSQEKEKIYLIMKEWWPKLADAKMSFDNEIIQSLRLTLHNKQVTYSLDFFNSYKKLGLIAIELPYEKDDKRVKPILVYLTMVLKDHVDQINDLLEATASQETIKNPMTKFYLENANQEIEDIVINKDSISYIGMILGWNVKNFNTLFDVIIEEANNE